MVIFMALAKFTRNRPNSPEIARRCVTVQVKRDILEKSLLRICCSGDRDLSFKSKFASIFQFSKWPKSRPSIFHKLLNMMLNGTVEMSLFSVTGRISNKGIEGLYKTKWHFVVGVGGARNPIAYSWPIRNMIYRRNYQS